MTDRPKFGAGSMSTEKKEPKQEVKEEKTEETPEPSSEETVEETTTSTSSKPKFGAGSMSTKKQEPKQEEKAEKTPKDSSEQTIEESTASVSSAPKSFGAGTNESTDEKKHSSIGDIFKNQGVAFWIVSYVASFLIYTFLNTSFGIFKTLNLLLFPFTLILFSQLQVFLTGSMNGLAHWIAPDFKAHGVFSSGFTAILWYISKLGLYYLVWGFSYVLGIIGMVMIFVTNKKINR